MCELNSAAVALLLGFSGAFMSLLLVWYSQTQRVNTLEGRVLEAEKGEKDCIAREARHVEEIVLLKQRVGILEQASLNGRHSN